MIELVLLVAGLICLVAAALKVPAAIDLGWAGLFLIFLRELI
jgi:hypothetical protein